jgi:hypothetical protein
LKRKIAIGSFTIGIIIVLIVVILSSSSPTVPSYQIVIRPDGSIYPPSASLQRDGNTYTFLDTIDEEILIQKNNIVIDGKGLTLDLAVHQSQAGSFWKLSDVNNITIRHIRVADRNHLTLKNCQFCEVIDTNFTSINLINSQNNLLSENPYIGSVYLENSERNTISFNPTGEIELRDSSYNKILNNRIIDLSSHAFTTVNSHYNLFFSNIVSYPVQMWLCFSGDSSNNLLVANNVTGPFVIDAVIEGQSTNLFYHNNFVNATARYQSTPLNNLTAWDNGSEGNYWSNYNGEDNNHDGIGDTPHVIDENNQDLYPLMHPVNILQEEQPQMPEPQKDTVLSLGVAIAVVAIIAAVGIGLAVYRRRKLTKILDRFDETFPLAAIFPILSGIALLASVFFGFGSYLALPYYRGGWATYGHMHRLLLISFPALAFCLVIAGLGYRKIGKKYGDTKAFLKFIPTAFTSAVLIYAAVLVAQAHPIYVDGSVGPYWNQCFFENIDQSVAYTQLTFISFVLLGITQLTWRLTLNQAQLTTPSAKIRMSALLQMISGIGFLVATIILYMNPAFEQASFSLPQLLSLLFLLAQALSSTSLLYSRRTNA